MNNQNLDYLTPEQRDWWLAHADVEPTLILRCGIDGCRRKVGEVKTDESKSDIAIALMYSMFGERTVPYTPYRRSELGWAEEVRDANGKSLAEVLRERIDERDAETIRYVGDDRRVAKRFTARPTAMPLDWIGQFTCPDHGQVALPDPDATVAEMRKFLAGPVAKHARKRQYVILRRK